MHTTVALHLYKPDTLRRLRRLIHYCQTPQSAFFPIRYPIEEWFLKFLVQLVESLPVTEKEDLTLKIHNWLEQRINTEVHKVAVVLSRHSRLVSGSEVWAVVEQKRVLWPLHRESYNALLPEPAGADAGTGITRALWVDYNHFILSAACWAGLVTSWQPGYQRFIPSVNWIFKGDRYTVEQLPDKLVSPDSATVSCLHEAMGESGFCWLEPEGPAPTLPDGSVIEHPYRILLDCERWPLYLKGTHKPGQ